MTKQPFALVTAELIAHINPAYTCTVTKLGDRLTAYVVRHGSRCYVCIPHGRALEGVTLYTPTCTWTATRSPRTADADTLESILATIRAEVRS